MSEIELLERKAAYRKAAGPRAQLVGIEGLAALLNKSPETARRISKLPGFPMPLDIPGDACWLVADIAEWLAQRKRLA